MRGFIVRDIRKKEKFLIDDAYLNGYARILKPSITVVYLSLCRHAGIDQKSFPSLKLIAEQHSISTKTVQRGIKRLAEANIIKIARIRNKSGRWLNNTYFLLDKSVWKKPRGHQSPMDNQRTFQTKPEDVGVLYTIKETHKKETHVYHPLKNYSSLKDITEQDLQEISKKYKVSIGFVKLQFEKLQNYCEAKGKKYKNYKSALRNFVLGDMQRSIERRQDDTKRGVDLSHLG